MGEVMAAGPPEVPPPGSRGRRVLVGLAVAVLALAGAATAVAFFLLRGTGDVIDRLIPTSTNVYVTAYLDPAASQKVNLVRLSRKFPALKDSKVLSGRIDGALDQGLRDMGVTAADVRPWLGSQIALAVRLDELNPAFAFFVASKDDEAARAALEKARRSAEAGGQAAWTESTRKGVVVFQGTLAGTPTAYTLIDHAVVVSNSIAFLDEVIATSQGTEPPLSSSSIYVKTTGSLSTERLGLAYVDTRSFVEQMGQAALRAGADPSQVRAGKAELGAFSGFGAILTAQPDGLRLDVTSGAGRPSLGSPSPAAPSLGVDTILPYVPAKSFAVLAVSGVSRAGGDEDVDSILDRLPVPLGDQVRQLDQVLGLSEALRHLTGSIALGIGPGANSPLPDGAIVMGIDDSAAFGSFLDRLAAYTFQELTFGSTSEPDLTSKSQAYRGVQITRIRIPILTLFGIVPAYAVTEDVAIVATSPNEVRAVLDAKRSGAGVATTPTFRQAVGSPPTAGPLVYADIQGIAAAIRSSLSSDERLEFDATVLPNLRPMKAFVMSAGREGSFRVFLLIP